MKCVYLIINVVSITVLVYQLDAKRIPYWSCYDKSCYSILLARKTWTDARKECKKIGGDLASANSKIDYQHIIGTIADNNKCGSFTGFWLGGYEKATEGNWVWMDGSKFKYTNWHRGQPDGTGLECVGFWSTGPIKNKWRDYNCGDFMIPICERKNDKNVGHWSCLEKACYMIVVYNRIWKDAQNDCKEKGGDLASIRNQKEQKYTQDLIIANECRPPSTYWIGASDVKTESKWTWTDGSTFIYNNWNSGEPNNANNAEDCVVLSETNYKWNDIDCNYLRGYICKKPISQCKNPNPCKNGKCTDIENGYKCKCNPGYTGLNCDKAISRCKNMNPCKNGKCTDIENGYKCKCNPGYTGLNCDKAISRCKNPNPCKNGKCSDIENGYKCKCNPGYTGLNCDKAVSRCKNPNPCKNGKCTDTESGYKCQCNSGYTGLNCDKAINNIFPQRYWSCWGKSCYTILSEKKNWRDASKDCRRLGADLASIHDEAEYVHVLDLIKWNKCARTSGYWLGATDPKRNGKYTWTDGSDFDYTYWFRGQPRKNGGTAYCLGTYIAKYTQNKWFGFPCDGQMSSICKLEKNKNVGEWSCFEKSCYKIHIDGLIWKFAHKDCTQMGGNLASVHTQKEHKFIRALIEANQCYPSQSYWLGASDNKKEGKWTWTDGSAFDFRNWNSGEPSNTKDENCGQLDGTTYKWKDHNCFKSFPYICKKERIGCTSPNPCKNGACTTLNGGGYKCQCNPGYTGLKCDKECTDMVSLTLDKPITHGAAKSMVGNVNTAILLEDTILGSNIYYAYITPICYIKSKIEYNCLAIKVLKSDKDLINMSNRFCWNNELVVHANCKLPTVRIANAFLFCQLEYHPLTKQNAEPTIVKVSLASGEIIKTRRFSKGSRSSGCLQSLYRDARPGCSENVQQYNMQIMASKNGLWVAYPAIKSKKTYYVHQISIDDLKDIPNANKKEFPLDLKENEQAIVICDKLYVMSVNDSLTITKAFDLQNPNNTFNYPVRFAHDVKLNIQSWLHFNPKVGKVFVGSPKNIKTRVFILNECMKGFPDKLIVDLKSTFLWSLEPSDNNHLKEMIEKIMRYFSISDINKLSAISDALLSCPSSICNSKNNMNNMKMLFCRVKSVMMSLNTYSTYRKNKTEKKKRLQIKFRMDKILEQQGLLSVSVQVYELKSFMALNFQKLRVKLDSFRKDVGNYFSHLADFDTKRSRADVDYIYDSMIKFKKAFFSKSNALAKDLAEIVNNALLAYNREKYDKMYTLGTTLVSLYNPLHQMIKGALLSEDFKSAVNDLTSHLTKATKLNKLSIYFEKLSSQLSNNTKKVKSVFEKQTTIKQFVYSAMNSSLENKALLGNIEKFLDEYNAFKIGYDRILIIGVESTIELIIQEGCNVIDEAQSASTKDIKEKSAKPCMQSKIDLGILVGSFEEMASFRDSLMDALASYVRSILAKRSALHLISIKDEIKTENKDLLTLQVYASQMFASSEVHKMIMVRDACTIIEYLNGGIMPYFCLKAIENPSGPYFRTVKAFPFEREMCADKIDKFVEIPVVVRVSKTTKLSPGTLDINSLLNGTETYFQIPNREWLVRNGWVQEKDSHKMMVLKRFEIYIPIPETVTNKKKFRVSIQMIGNNAIVPSGTVYPFNVPVVYNSRYSINEDVCLGKQIKNLYPKSNDSRNLCLYSLGTDNLLLHPSIYAKWKITTELSDLKPKLNVSEEKIKGAVSMCIIQRYKENM